MDLDYEELKVKAKDVFFTLSQMEERQGSTVFVRGYRSEQQKKYQRSRLPYA